MAPVAQTRLASGSDDEIENDAQVFIIGADRYAWGNGSAWTSAHGLVRLRWPDRANAGLQMRVGSFGPTSTSVQVSFTFEPTTVTAATP